MGPCVRELSIRIPPPHLVETLLLYRSELLGLYRSLSTYRGMCIYGVPEEGLIVMLSLWENDSEHDRISPDDLVAYIRNRHRIAVEIVAIRTMSHLHMSFAPGFAPRVRSQDNSF
jgi:hypothetical protein